MKLRQDYVDGKIDLIAPNLIFYGVGKPSVFTRSHRDGDREISLRKLYGGEA